MYLTSLLHREELFELTERWFNDDLRPDDGQRVSELFLYESMVSAPALQDYMLRFFQRLYGTGLSVQRVSYKNDLRQRLIEGITTETPRIRHLASHYSENPEDFFPGLPVDALLLYGEDQRLLSISRIKRPARLAEKAAYRMADALADLIRSEAEQYAADRAMSEGVPLGKLISSETQMSADFMAAERRVASRFREGDIALRRRDLEINDIVGFKIIGDPEELARAERVLAEESQATIVEHEEHRGPYNAINLQVDIDLPPVGQLVDEAQDMDWSVAAERGLNPDKARGRFAEFLETGARSLRTEVVLTTYPELMESEFGRSLHERRILRLRERQSYSGPIAENARYLIEFLLSVAYAPTCEVPALPIKMWGQYLPETLIHATRGLYGIDSTGVLLRTLYLGGNNPARWRPANKTGS